MRSIGLAEERGAVCMSLLHYNTEEEIERFIDVLHGLATAG